MSRLLAIDPGDVHIGLALSDPLQMIASPLETFKHISRQEDAALILEKARENHVSAIIVGVAYDQEGQIGPQARKAFRLIEQLVKESSIPVIPWDESGSTVAAESKASPDQSLDARAAAVILQDYLDAKNP